MNRRAVLHSAAATTALGLSASLVRAAGAEAGNRPNILWLISEDNYPFIGSFGDRLAHTPHIDALAKRGTLFRNAYATAPVCAPSRFALLTGMYPESFGPAHHMRARGHVPPAFRTCPELLREAGYYCTNTAKTDYNCDLDPAALWDATGEAAHWRNRAEGQPFFAVVTIETTHEAGLFMGAAAPSMPRLQSRLPAYLPDVPEIRADLDRYRDLMTAMDAEVGARLRAVAEAGLSNSTVVFYFSDNGGVLPRSKPYCYEEGLHCPLIVAVPPRWQSQMALPAGSTVEVPVSFIDIVPTVLALLALPAFLLCFASTREQIDTAPAATAREPLSLAALGRDMVVFFRILRENGPLLRIFLVVIIVSIAITMYSKNLIYFFKYDLKDMSALKMVLPLLPLVSILAIPVWVQIIKRTSKRDAFLMASAAGSLALLALFFNRFTQTWIVGTLLIAISASLIAYAVCFWSMLPDTVEYGEWKTGERHEAKVFGFSSFAQKVALGVAAFLLGVSLEAIGFVPNAEQSPETLLALRALIALIPVAGIAAAAALVWGYPIDAAFHARIRAEIAARRPAADE